MTAQSPPAASNHETRPGKVNVNTAGEEALASLPRIGQALARRIIAYRQANGPFRRIDDLKNVPGIGDATFIAIKALVSVGD